MSAPDLPGQLTRLLNHAISPSEFWGWFEWALPDIERDASDRVVDLAAWVELRFAEWTSGYVSDATLIATLAADAALLDAPPPGARDGAAPDGGNQRPA